ncbi:VOC family protein [Aestuariivirga litoralis]|uniref:VOC family protein n=1 Tax=Aestuariivirga litoralis TaxID=2650924 RepID=UPI0018C60502|nr:VOC family protein [Aestuariivirga litoralis]MBG1233070.1 ring-cleaving dioxygenase [Aestuariivirga litoralis]
MINAIKGLHHVTSFAGDAQNNNHFFTKTLGLRRVKKTVNFDAPDVYHLYYGDEQGTPGSVMTYFPFPNIGRATPGVGEVGRTLFSVPKGSLGYWEERLTAHKVGGLSKDESFGAKQLHFTGVDGDSFALVETEGDKRAPWTQGGVDGDHAIRGFHSTSLRLRDEGATAELLKFMGYTAQEKRGDVHRFVMEGGNGADVIDLQTLPGAAMARAGSGTVHHVAFAVENRAKQLEVRKALMDTGYQVTPVIDRDYFWAIYFRTPGGVLFEVSTNEPGFARDEELAHLGEGLRLPKQHEHLRAMLDKSLQPIIDAA